MQIKTPVFRTSIESQKDAETAVNLSSIVCRSASEVPVCNIKSIPLNN